MTTEETLDLALEVLQINLKLLEKINPYKGQEDLLSDSLDLTHKAIAAIKQARAAPVQEPVGVFMEDDDIGHVRLIPHQQMKLKDGDKLYTTPPAQRTWVDLTDEEIYKIDCLLITDITELVIAIEAKLKEKNT